MHVFAVVGDGDTRKTSTIRALTGVGRLEPRWEMAFTEGGHGVVAVAPRASDLFSTGSGSVRQGGSVVRKKCYVRPGGLQEGRYIMPDDIVAEIDALGVQKAILALRYDAVGRRPSARVYLDRFRAQGWTVDLVVLGRQLAVVGYPDGQSFPDSARRPSNEMAAELREAWRIR